MLIGVWKNVEELEESLTIPELDAVISASREKEHRHNKFMAALKGFNLDDTAGGSAKDKVEEIKKRAEAKMAGKSTEELDFEDMGIKFETE